MDGSPFIHSGGNKRKWGLPDIESRKRFSVNDDSLCTTTHCNILTEDNQTLGHTQFSNKERDTFPESTSKITCERKLPDEDRPLESADGENRAESSGIDKDGNATNETNKETEKTNNSEDKAECVLSNSASIRLMDTYGGSLLDVGDEERIQYASDSDSDSNSESESDGGGDDVINRFLTRSPDFRVVDDVDGKIVLPVPVMSPDVQVADYSDVFPTALEKGGIVEEWTSTEEVTVEEKEEEFNPYIFIKNLPPRIAGGEGLYGFVKSLPLLPPLLPSDPPFCLVLDLDETLVHCSTETLSQPDLVFPVTFNSIEYTVFARKRPHIFEFLSRVSALFEVVVFTASQEVYADKLLNILDPEKKYIRHRLFRDSCLCVDGNYLKDLTLLGRDLSKVVIVDNSPQAFGYHVDNGIPIESWFDDDNDTELLSVSAFLENYLLPSPDVRPVLREKYKLHELIARA